MIRIQLHPARGRRALPLLLLGTGSFLAAALVFSLLRETDYTGLWPGSREALLSPSAAPGAGEVKEAAIPPEKAPEQERPQAAPKVAPLPSPAPAPVREEPVEPKPQKTAARASPKVEKKPEPLPALQLAQAPPPLGPLSPGLRALQLFERLPASIRCTSLAGNRAGEYTIEGAIPPPDVAQLFVLLETLQGLPSRVTLDFWREGRQEAGDYRLTFRGQFAITRLPAPEPVSPAEAAALFAQVMAWGRQSRLDSVRVSAPILAPQGQGLVQHRQKLWARGTYSQLRTFAELLVQLQAKVALEELVVVPVYRGGEAGWKQAQFYAVLSAAVK